MASPGAELGTEGSRRRDRQEDGPEGRGSKAFGSQEGSVYLEQSTDGCGGKRGLGLGTSHVMLGRRLRPVLVSSEERLWEKRMSQSSPDAVRKQPGLRNPGRPRTAVDASATHRPNSVPRERWAPGALSGVPRALPGGHQLFKIMGFQDVPAPQPGRSCFPLTSVCFHRSRGVADLWRSKQVGSKGRGFCGESTP